MTATQTFQLNGIARTAQTVQSHLAEIDGNYVVELLGRSAEAYADRALQFELKHRDFKSTVHVTLQTDAHPDDGSKRDQAQDQIADTEPSIGVSVEAGQVTVKHQNLAAATVNYYEMDLEFLFSSNPFVGSGGADRFSIIKPNLSAPLKLGGKTGEKKFALPEAFRSTNVLVEVVAAGQKSAQAYYAHSLAVTIVENYGRLEVRDAKTRKPLSKAYLKVYSRDRDGSVKFYKDGYTDLRGKFDYASLNTSQLGTAQRFAILVMTEKNGSLVKEAAPPKQ